MQGLDFIAVDVETANADRGSICQVGLAMFKNGQLLTTWHKLCNPDCHFDAGNISIHGIEPGHVRDAPKLESVIRAMSGVLDGHVLVAHSGFDNDALRAAGARYGVATPFHDWIDTVKVARLTWPEFPDHRLATVAGRLSIDFRHHDALEDAVACGQILVEASRLSGYGVAEWLSRQSAGARRKSPQGSAAAGYKNSRSVDGDPGGPLAGEVIVFTGEIGLDRQECARLAAAAGCDVRASVTKKTTILVVGEQDLALTGGHAKSSKHRRADELIAAGQDIRILGEREFLDLVRR